MNSRLTNLSECIINTHSFCYNSTCYNASSILCSTIDCNATDLICMSNCLANSTEQCNRGFQCDDGSLGLAFQFCDGIYNCCYWGFWCLS